MIERFLPQFEQCYDDRYARAIWSLVPRDRRRGTRLSPLRRPALRLRAGPLSGLPARDARGLLLSPTLLVPQLPSATALLAAETIAHTICQSVPHRQLVFTIPQTAPQYTFRSPWAAQRSKPSRTQVLVCRNVIMGWQHSERTGRQKSTQRRVNRRRRIVPEIARVLIGCRLPRVAVKGRI